MYTDKLIEYEKKYKKAIEEGIVKPPKEKKKNAKKATKKESKVISLLQPSHVIHDLLSTLR